MKRVFSGIIFMLLLMDMCTLAFKIQPVKASGTIYIRADGSVDPPTAPISTVDNMTYTLTDNISSDADGIVIERDNMTLDGAGYSIQGSNGGAGVDVSNRVNIAIENVEIHGFHNGIFLNCSSSISISENNITGNDNAVYFDTSSNNSVFGNNMTCICLSDCKHDSFLGNNMTLISLSGHGGYFDNGFLVPVSSEGNIFFGNNMTCIQIDVSNNNTIFGNNINADRLHGTGVELFVSDGNVVDGNNITGGDGIFLCGCYGNGNSICGNSLYNSGVGIYLWSCYNTSISGNNIANNGFGVKIDWNMEDAAGSLGTRFCRNNFMNNTYQVASFYYTSSIWDDGFPGGGNYWSDYNGTDLYSGSYQNLTGSDGIGDTPYTIDGNNNDHYPLMKHYDPLAGDVNYDGKVGWDDIAIVVAAFGTVPSRQRWNPLADVNHDGKVNMKDIAIAVYYFNQHE